MKPTISPLRAKAAVVLPVYNAAIWVEKCILSLEQGGLGEDFDLYIQDDASPQASVGTLLSQLAQRRPDIYVEKNSKNLGFLGTCNLLFQRLRSDYEYIILCNSDVMVSRHAIRSGLQYMDAHSDAALLSFLANRGGQLSINLPDGVDYADASEYLKSKAYSKPIHAVTSVGHLLVIRVAAIDDKDSLFDPIYGKGYGEESDLHYRLLSRGWKAQVLPNDFVYHRGETSFGVDALKPQVGIFYERWTKVHEAALLVESQADSLAWFRDAATNEVAKDQLKSLKQFARERFRQRLKNTKGATTATVALSLYALTEFFDEVCMALIDLKQSYTEVLAVAEGEMPMIRRLPVKTFVLSQPHHPELSAYLADAERYGQVHYLQDYRHSSDKFRATFHQLANSRDSLEALPIGGQLECSIHERVLVVAPDYTVSGGIFVIAEFIAALKKNGMQVVVGTPRGARHPPNHNYGAEIYSLEYLAHKNGQPFALMVVTAWESLFWASRVPAERFLWLAQSIEEYFVDPERLSERLRIIAPYLVRGVQVISVSHWIQTVLSVRFGISSTLIENQLSPLVDWFQYPRVRNWESIQEPKDASVVVEGSCAKFKNLEEAIDTVEQLGFVRKTLIFAGSLEDRNFLENRDLSGWTVLNNIDREDVLKRFSESDILVRTSALDSFGFAPLEMMVTGGLVMIKPYQGAPGHCMNGYNALFFSDASDLRSHFARQKESGSIYFKKIAENGLSFAQARIGVAQEAYVKAVRDILQTVTDPMLVAALQLLCSWRNVGMQAWPQLESAIGRAHNIGVGVVDQLSTKGLRVNMAPLRYRLVDAIVLKGIKRLIPVELYKSLKIVLEKL